MRLKKVFAGVLAAAMLVCAVAVPAFAAEEVEQENCLSSSYVQMNIPYADFYKAAGVYHLLKTVASFAAYPPLVLLMPARFR